MKRGIRTGALAAGVAIALGLGGCAADMTQNAAAATAEKPMAKELYVVLPENGRVYAFGDTKNYFDFLKNDEVALTRTKIGAGPGGKTLVYGITKDDVKKNQPSLGELVFEGKLSPAPDFHGEVFRDGRYYVFGNLQDMMAFAAFGEVPYSYTDIGAAADGRTLVWVMNKESYKKGRPVSTIARFQSLRAAQ